MRKGSEERACKKRRGVWEIRAGVLHAGRNAQGRKEGA